MTKEMEEDSKYSLMVVTALVDLKIIIKMENLFIHMQMDKRNKKYIDRDF